MEMHFAAALEGVYLSSQADPTGRNTNCFQEPDEVLHVN